MLKIKTIKKEFFVRCAFVLLTAAISSFFLSCRKSDSGVTPNRKMRKGNIG